MKVIVCVLNLTFPNYNSEQFKSRFKNFQSSRLILGPLKVKTPMLESKVETEGQEFHNRFTFPADLWEEEFGTVLEKRVLSDPTHPRSVRGRPIMVERVDLVLRRMVLFTVN